MGLSLDSVNYSKLKSRVENGLSLNFIKMADDLSKRRPQDETKVNVNEAWEVDFWCDKWKITKKQLSDAVKAVGVSAAAVAKHLGK